MLHSFVRPLAVAGLLAVALPALAQSPIPKPTECVAVELRVVNVSGKEGREVVTKLFQATDERACCETASCAVPTVAKTALLDGAQLKELLEKCQQDHTTTMMQAPKVTLFDGQTAPISMVDSVRFTTGLDVKLVDGNPVMTPKEEKVELGTSFRVSGKLSADRKHVKLDLKYHDKHLASPHVPLHPVTTYLVPRTAHGKEVKGGEVAPFTQFIQNPTFRELSFETTVAVPDGGTVAVHAGKQKVRAKTEFGLPVVSQIPYLNRLFKNNGIAEIEQDVVVMATAKCVEQEPVEVKANVVILAAARMSPDAVSKPTELLTAYHEACAKGDKDAAMRLAVQALAQDPTCFSRSK